MNREIIKFSKCRILVIGDLMLDEYVWGEVDRISPEAPVQVVSVIREDYTLGGAGNVVNNLAALGATVLTVGVMGDGEDGARLLEKFAEFGLDTAGIVQEPNRFTTRKTRILAAHQHVLRIDRETKKEISGSTYEKVIKFAEKAIPDVDVILISDYGKGLLTGTLLKRVIAYARKQGKMTLADPKGLDFSKYAGVSLLTPNQKEAALASGMDIRDESSLLKAGERLLERTGIENLLITCGKGGMVLFERENSPHQISTDARQVFDVSGAGDTVVAVMGLAMASGLSLKESATLANTAAGIVVAKVGTATLSMRELAAATEAHPH